MKRFLTLQFLEETQGVSLLLLQPPPLLFQSSLSLPALLQTDCHSLGLAHSFLMQRLKKQMMWIYSSHFTIVHLHPTIRASFVYSKYEQHLVQVIS